MSLASEHNLARSLIFRPKDATMYQPSICQIWLGTEISPQKLYPFTHMQNDVSQGSTKGCAAGKSPLVCGAGCHIHTAVTVPGKDCSTRTKNTRPSTEPNRRNNKCMAPVRKDQHAEKCCLDLLRELRQDLECDSESLAFEAVQRMERHLEVQL